MKIFLLTIKIFYDIIIKKTFFKSPPGVTLLSPILDYGLKVGPQFVFPSFFFCASRRQNPYNFNHIGIIHLIIIFIANDLPQCINLIDVTAYCPLKTIIKRKIERIFFIVGRVVSYPHTIFMFIFV